MSVCGHCRCQQEDSEDAFKFPSVANKIDVYSSDKMAMYITGRAIEVFAWGKLYRTSLFEDIRFLLGRYHEDAYTTYKLVHKANKVVNTIMIGYAYRNNSYSIMNAGFTL